MRTHKDDREGYWYQVVASEPALLDQVRPQHQEAEPALGIAPFPHLDDKHLEFEAATSPGSPVRPDCLSRQRASLARKQMHKLVDGAQQGGTAAPLVHANPFQGQTAALRYTGHMIIGVNRHALSMFPLRQPLPQDGAHASFVYLLHGLEMEDQRTKGVATEPLLPPAPDLGALLRFHGFKQIRAHCCTCKERRAAHQRHYVTREQESRHVSVRECIRKGLQDAPRARIECLQGPPIAITPYFGAGMCRDKRGREEKDICIEILKPNPYPNLTPTP